MTPNTAATSSTAFWASPFRPFFFLTGVYAILVVIGWLATLFQGWPLNGDLPPLQWHSHEVLFGMVAAAVAGFLLTAMSNWTGVPALAGPGLVALVVLWLGGRVAMWSSAWLPLWLVSAVDLSFLLVVGVYAGRVIIGTRNHRNLVMVVVVGALWLANGLFHLGLWRLDSGLLQRAEYTSMMLITLLMVLIGGRITPAFTGNWLARQGRDRAQVRSNRYLDGATIATTAALVPAVLAAVPATLLAPLALLAAVLNGLRLVGWAGWLSWRDPLLLILHIGHVWIVIGLALLAVAGWSDRVQESAWLHALGVGAMGVLIVGVMSRVALGHTGRPLELPGPALVSFALIVLAATVRVLAGLGMIPSSPGLVVAGLAWIGAFTVFILVYTPILIRPRADGRPG